MTDRDHLPVRQDPPRLLQLREGTDLVIRTGGHLQFGTVPAHALVLGLPPEVGVDQIHQVMRELRRPMADTTVVRLLGHCGLPGVHARGILDELVDAGVLTIRPAVFRTRVHVLGPSLHVRALLRRLRQFDITCSGTVPGTPAFGRLGPDDLVVLAGTLFPPAEVSYRLMDAGVPHLTCGVVDARVAVGPMVVPGATGCLSCLDAASLAADACWRTVRERAGDAVTPTVDRLVELSASLAAGLVREVLVRREAGDGTDRGTVNGTGGGTGHGWAVPDTLTVRRYLDPLTLKVAATEVPRHPGCAACAVAPV